MGLVNIAAFGNKDSYWYSHWQDHLKIVQAIKTNFGVDLPTYNLYPWSDAQNDSILERHQQYHQDMDNVLKNGNRDLTDVDFKDDRDRSQWVYWNYQLHLAAYNKLNVGPAAVTSYLLLESGFKIILESGSGFLELEH